MESLITGQSLDASTLDSLIADTRFDSSSTKLDNGAQATTTPNAVASSGHVKDAKKRSAHSDTSPTRKRAKKQENGISSAAPACMTYSEYRKRQLDLRAKLTNMDVEKQKIGAISDQIDQISSACQKNEHFKTLETAKVVTALKKARG